MIGEMKHRITFQRSVRVPDGGGGFTETWQSLDSSPDVYAAILPLSGGERLRFHQYEASVTHRIVTRYRSDVTPAMRIVKGTTIYDIASVTDRDGRGAYLEIAATEKVL